MWAGRRLGRGLAPPDWLSINLTLRCNLSCVMCTTCYDTPELSTAEVLDLVDQAASWGVRVFNPLGGEPFVRTDLETILAHAARRDMHTTLTTNGTLITEARAARIAEIPPEKLHINISIDGLSSHDDVRGKGSFARMIAGYRRLRAADAAAGNPTRKICANSILHAKNVAEYLDLVAFLEAEAFSGMQVLHLFRSASDADVGGMWFKPEQLPALEAVCRVLAGHALVMNRDALPLVPRYYREGIGPLEAPCWAGWKELYVNADGSAIMCDGKLDFLAGRFGSVREHTLRELWRCDVLKERREVVRNCTTPCIQGCYLRRESDALVPIAKGLLDNVTRPARARVARRLPARTIEGVLAVELCDIPDDPDHASVQRFFARSPVSLSELHADPERLPELRDRGYLDFGRGFGGASLVAHLRDALREARLRFSVVTPTWRGDPLFHPEFEAAWDALEGLGSRIRVTTSGRLVRAAHLPLLRHAEVWTTTSVPGLDTRRGRPTEEGFAPAMSWEGHVVASVADVTLRHRVGDVLKEPFGAIWARFPAG
jgi:MoaA/NifB/PqqE/SkfB family radical SAM enzyme